MSRQKEYLTLGARFQSSPPPRHPPFERPAEEARCRGIRPGSSSADYGTSRNKLREARRGSSGANCGKLERRLPVARAQNTAVRAQNTAVRGQTTESSSADHGQLERRLRSARAQSSGPRGTHRTQGALDAGPAWKALAAGLPGDPATPCKTAGRQRNDWRQGIMPSKAGHRPEGDDSGPHEMGGKPKQPGRNHARVTKQGLMLSMK